MSSSRHWVSTWMVTSSGMRSSSTSWRTKSKSVWLADGNPTSISLKPMATSVSNMRRLRTGSIGSISGLVAVAQVDRAPARRLGELAVGPRAVRQLERHERLVLLERHLLRLCGFGRHVALSWSAVCSGAADERTVLGKARSSRPEGAGASASAWKGRTRLHEKEEDGRRRKHGLHVTAVQFQDLPMSSRTAAPDRCELTERRGLPRPGDPEDAELRPR